MKAAQIIRNTGFLTVALIIDLAQAGISAGLSVIAAFPGTIGGGAAGCAAGSYFLGQVGCWAAGGVLAVFGSVLNPLLATVTIPIGFAFGFAINMCLSLVGGAFLLTLMALLRDHISWNRLFWGGGELIPGLNNIPFWTFFVIASMWDDAKNKNEEKGILGLASIAVLPTRGIMSAKEATGMLAAKGARGWTPQPEEWAEQPSTSRDKINSAGRVPLQDVRPASTSTRTANDNRPYAQAA